MCTYMYSLALENSHDLVVRSKQCASGKVLLISFSLMPSNFYEKIGFGRRTV